jgi:hypothetical protein
MITIELRDVNGEVGKTLTIKLESLEFMVRQAENMVSEIVRLSPPNWSEFSDLVEFVGVTDCYGNWRKCKGSGETEGLKT